MPMILSLTAFRSVSGVQARKLPDKNGTPRREKEQLTEWPAPEPAGCRYYSVKAKPVAGLQLKSGPSEAHAERGGTARCSGSSWRNLAKDMTFARLEHLLCTKTK